MSALLADAGGWLLQAAAALPDTIITKQVAVERSWFEKVTSVASGLMTISILVLTAALVPAAINFRNSYKKINDLMDRIYGDINPLMRHASSVADNLDYITTSIRVDVQQVNQTIATANQKLMEAVELTERRLNEFNALLGVVQQEAEDVFVSTASTIRGVRTGAATFERESLGGGRGAFLPAADDLDDLEETEDTFDDAPEYEEELDGDFDGDLGERAEVDAAPDPLAAAPRRGAPAGKRAADVTIVIAEAGGDAGTRDAADDLATDLDADTLYDAGETDVHDSAAQTRPGPEKPRVRPRRRPRGDA
ncbi:MAG: hypothetical protein ACJ8AO_22815 [Gemmatimonadaceae bacterium]